MRHMRAPRIKIGALLGRLVPPSRLPPNWAIAEGCKVETSQITSELNNFDAARSLYCPSARRLIVAVDGQQGIEY